MFIHYIKIAFRNMWKYKSQSLISIIGLAVGFTCFALATLWIRYEMTFDSFHKNAKQMYVVYTPNRTVLSGYARNNSILMAAYLKETFPEIENAASVVFPRYTNRKITVKNVEFPTVIIEIDTSFFRMFDVKILEGSSDFLIAGSNKIAITREKARQLFGNGDPIGKTVINNRGVSFTICAVVAGMPKPSNYPYDFIASFNDFIDPFSGSSSLSWGIIGANTIIELFPGTNIAAFEKKLYEHVITAMDDTFLDRNRTVIKPITKVRYTDPDVERDVQFQYILIFAISGFLVVLCSLFNYLMSFVSRFRIRQKEMALRVVCGASGRSLLTMLSVEFMLMLLFAVVLSSALTQLFHRPFLTLSYIQMNLSAIFYESLMYIGSVILVALLAFWILLIIFRYRSLNLTIRQTNTCTLYEVHSKKLFRKVSLVVQLMISIGFAFCTIIILKQMYFLQHSGELGFSFKNRGSISVSGQKGSIYANQLKQLPEITEVIDPKGGMYGLLPDGGGGSGFRVSSWDDEPAEAESLIFQRIIVSLEYLTFFDFRLLAGEMLSEGDAETLVLINEDAAKAFGWHNPVGKKFEGRGARYTVKGVIKNIYNRSLTVKVFRPAYYTLETLEGNFLAASVLFEYKEGTWKFLKPKIEKLIHEDDLKTKSIYNYEEEFSKYFKSENALIKLFSFISVICVLICLSGFVSLVLLNCEERRKSIAIRKINGATAGDILYMFAKEYTLLLFIGAAIALTAGYFIMQRWLEHYVKQTSIPAWIYLSIICALALVIMLCVGWQVYKSSIENPADVVKSE